MYLCIIIPWANYWTNDCYVCSVCTVCVHVSTIVILSPLSDPFDLSHNLGTVVSVRSELSSGITVNWKLPTSIRLTPLSLSLSCIAASVLVFKFIHNVFVNVANFFGAGGKHQLTLKNMCEKGHVEYWVSAWTRSMLPWASLEWYCGYCLNSAEYIVLTWYLTSYYYFL